MSSLLTSNPVDFSIQIDIYHAWIAAYMDPLKKREEFAVSLRKKKTHEIINAKRRRLGGATAQQDAA